MTDEEPTPIFERGDVVYGDDPFKGEDAARPWLVLSNHEDRPFHGEQYIAQTLTTNSWMDGLIEIPGESWLRGGTPEESRIVPWGVQSIDHADIDFWQGRVESELVDEAAAALVEELQWAIGQNIGGDQVRISVTEFIARSTPRSNQSPATRNA